MLSLAVTPLHARFAAQISGVDLRQPLCEDDAQAIREALARHSVLVFRNQHIDTEQHKAFAAIFGPLEATPSRKMVGIDDPVRIIDRGVFKGKGNNKNLSVPPQPGEEYKLWHVDDTYFPQIPHVATLRPEALSPTGGDTSWASMAAAFDSLSPVLRGWLEGLDGVHTAPDRLRDDLGLREQPKDVQQRYEEQSVCLHPLVIRHPQSGRIILFANPMFTTAIDRLSERESDMLLRHLLTEAVRPELVYRHQWEIGDLVVWDELATIHRGPSDVPAERRLIRIYAGLATPTSTRQAIRAA